MDYTVMAYGGVLTATRRYFRALTNTRGCIDTEAMFKCVAKHISMSKHMSRHMSKRARSTGVHTLFLATFRGMPTANAEGQIESEGSIGKGAEHAPKSRQK